jgi:hypothetical protein
MVMTMNRTQALKRILELCPSKTIDWAEKYLIQCEDNIDGEEIEDYTDLIEGNFGISEIEIGGSS